MNADVHRLLRFTDEVTHRFVAWAQTTVRDRVSAHVALAGGNTPRAVYETLASSPHREAVPWKSIHVYQGDERPVGPGHPESNWGMACKTLLDPVDLPHENRCRMHGEADDLHAAADAYADVLRDRLPMENHLPVFDLILLGIGTDGHTASLFPGTDALDETKRLVVANRVPPLETTRLTLTYPVLNAAREVWFLVIGSAKADIVSRILQEADQSLPAAWVCPTTGICHWLLDTDAAAGLPPK